MEISQLKKKFVEIYGGDESDIRVFSAAGRVNLIGEHIDYCGGQVFPAALNLRTVIIARKNGTDKINLTATTVDAKETLDINTLDAYKDLKWGDYQAGVAYVMFMKQANLGYTVYALNSTQNGENKYIETTMDPKAAAVFYVEVVDGGYKIYTEINGVKNGRQYVTTPNMKAGGAAFYSGSGDTDMGALEAKQWINAIINDTDPCVLPEQAYCVTRILEGIYESAKTGKPYYFENN